jgi:crossover junction endodeoxyribonuclease RusA
VKFWVGGIPVPQGSKRIVQPPGVKRTLLIDVNGKQLRAWRDTVARAALVHLDDWTEVVPIYLYLEFHLPRGKTVTRLRPHVRPDLDKLCRAVLDSLSGIAYRDDSQVVHITASKLYAGAEGPGVDIEVQQ